MLAMFCDLRLKHAFRAVKVSIPATAVPPADALIYPISSSLEGDRMMGLILSSIGKPALYSCLDFS